MTYSEACERAAAASRANPDCVQHVDCKLRRVEFRLDGPYGSTHEADPNGYSVSDWYSPATVVSFVNGKRN
jgi:hypothetical protein